MITIEYTVKMVSFFGSREEVQEYVDSGHSNSKVVASKKWLADNPEMKTLKELRVCVDMQPLMNGDWYASAVYFENCFSKTHRDPAIAVHELLSTKVAVCE